MFRSLRSLHADGICQLLPNPWTRVYLDSPVVTVQSQDIRVSYGKAGSQFPSPDKHTDSREPLNHEESQ